MDLRHHSATRAWALCALALLAGCGQEPAPPPEDETAQTPPSGAEEAPPAATRAEPDDEPEPEASPPEPSGPPKRIFAKRFVVNVRTGPSREALRIGYLRGGAVLSATTAAPVGDEGCRGGWYELTTGGFVCNGRDVIAFDGRRLPEQRAAQPDLEAPLPYQYGYVRRRVPMYRRLPTDEEAARYEGYRIPGQEPAPGAEGEATDAETAEGEGEGDAEGEAPPQAAPERAPAAPGPGDAEPAEEPDEPEENPAERIARLLDHPDAGTPTLELLAGEGDGVLMRWLMRGFFVSLDRDLRRGSRRYWRTQNNGFLPYTAITTRTGSDFEGVQLPEDHGLPVGWVMRRDSRVYTRNAAGRLRAGARVPQQTSFFITDTDEESRGGPYYVDPEGRYFRVRDVRELMEAAAPPDEVNVEAGEKWIDVNLERQILVAYEGARPVFATLISSGIIKREDDPELDHETPAGIFRVTSKHLTATMDGDNAIDGPYSVDDVPYVMYFQLAYALHSAYWHGRFGFPKSHGCVNMSPMDARWIWNWADPPVPEGWHGAYPTEDHPGTLIHIHGETPRAGGA